MNAGQIFLIAIGRIFLGSIFIIAGINKILDWQVMEEGLISALTDWQVYLAGHSFAVTFIEKFIEWGPFLLGVFTFLEVVGGLMVFLGIKVRWGAFFLFILLIPTTILYHSFWLEEGQKQDLETLMFMKNLAILGGVMILWAFGPIRNKMKHVLMKPPSQ